MLEVGDEVIRLYVPVKEPLRKDEKRTVLYGIFPGIIIERNEDHVVAETVDGDYWRGKYSFDGGGLGGFSDCIVKRDSLRWLFEENVELQYQYAHKRVEIRKMRQENGNGNE